MLALADSSTTLTSLTETSSTAVAETSSTTLIETSSTAVVESSSTTLVDTSSTSLAETSSTTPAETSTTSKPPTCVATQAVVNPSFDENDDAWNGIENVRSTDDPRSGGHNLRFGFFSGTGPIYTFSQALTNLQARNYRLKYHYRVASWSPWPSSAGFSCTIKPTIGGRQLQSVNPYQSGPLAWTEETQIWSRPTDDETVELSFSLQCAGEYDNVYLAIDDVTFTEIKCEPLQT